MRWISAFAASMLLISHAWAGVCEGCANPIVEVRPIQFSGDVPQSLRDYLRSGGGCERAWAWLEFKNRNRCADIQFIQDAGWKDPELLGSWGQAEYWVESTVNFTRANGKDRTLVMHQSGWDGNAYRTNQPALIPVIGRMTVRHELKALKNGQIYDYAETHYDWVGDPPEGDFYAQHQGPAVIGGKTYHPPDGLFLGDFSPVTAIAERIEFSKGDIGITIRKKETPSSATIEVDDTSAYPPDYLVTVPEIRNQFDEPMPDEIPVALRADAGQIEGGKPLDGWKVFTTKNGGLPLTIHYRPPKCSAKAKRATIELGDVCHWNDMKHIVRQARARQGVDLPLCGTFKGTITYQRQIHWKGEASSTYSTVKQTHDLNENATLFVTAKYLRTVKDGSEIVDYYEAQSLTGRFSYSLKQVSLTTDMKGEWNKTATTCQDSGWMEPGQSLMLTINRKTGKYTLSSQIIFPSKDNTVEVTSSEGAHETISTGAWAINTSLDVEEDTDGTSVSGQWSQPATSDTTVNNTGGMVPGAKWNWRLSRVGD